MAIVVNEKYAILGEFDYDNLIAGEQEAIIPKGVTLASGQGVLYRGTLLGIQTANGLAYVCDSTKSDGTQNPLYILGLQQNQLPDPTQMSVDTTLVNTNPNVPAMAYQTGIFNRNAVITKSGQSIYNFEQALRSIGIFLRGSITNPTFMVYGITMTPATMALSMAGTHTSQLTATITPTYATNMGVTYTTSDATKATVSSTGLVTGIAIGTATITATTSDGSYTATCVVTIGA